MTRPPLDLRNPPLRSAVGGYARADVESFLELVAEDYEAAHAALDSLRAEHARAMAALLEAREHEREVARVLSAAEQAAGQTLERAQQAASDRLEAAEAAGANLLRAADAERAQILADIDRTRYRQARIVRVLEAEIAGLLIPAAAGPAPAAPAAAIHAPTAAEAQSHPTATPLASDSAARVDAAEHDAPGAMEPVADRVAAGAPVVTSLQPVTEALAGIEAEPASMAAAVGTAVPALGEPPPVAAPALTVTPDASSNAPVLPSERSSDTPAIETIVEPGPPAPIAPAAASRRWVLVAAGVAAVVIISVVAIPWLGATAAPPRQPPASARQAAPAPAVAPSVERQPPPAAAAAAASPAPQPVPDNGITVRLEATSSCWVRLTMDGASEERLLAAGETLERTATGDVVLRTGNAGALAIRVNGRPIPPIGGEGEVVTRRITRPIAVAR